MMYATKRFRRITITSDSSDSDDDDLKNKEDVAAVMESSAPTPMRAHHHNFILLNLMIKNESRIIKRCLEAALPHVDAVAILDTGSTDETVAVATEVLTASGKPFKITIDPFQNFGISRTRSFENAQTLCTELGWDPALTYAMAVDADMNICPSAAFRDYPLTVNGYNVIQSNGTLKYYNTRFMKCSHPWKCIGATHEYWSGDPTERIPYEVFYIDDRNDGGCKSDKFERDVRLLTEEIAAEPNNGRSHFYLGQSLKDLGRFAEAIEKYKRRIEIGGWREEVWYSYYQIAKCYDHMKQPHEMELWMNKAFDFHPTRAEPLYFLCRYYREHSEHFKSYHYYLKGRYIPYPKEDVLFIEDQVYNGLFEYENTILACYVNGRTKQNSLEEIIKYINQRTPHYISNVWDNLHFYTESLTSSTYRGEYMRLPFRPQGPPELEYRVSSCSMVPYSNIDPNRRFIMNTRYVNYRIDERGCYHMRDPDQTVRTKNAVTFLNASGYPTEEVRMLTEDYEATQMPTYDSNICGLEDVRVFWHQGQLRFTASSKNASKEGHIVIVMGDYQPEQAKLTNMRVIQSPYGFGCEKNWIAVPSTSLSGIPQAQGKQNFIYGWEPMEIGAVNPETNKLEIHTKYQTPALFNRFRGSSTLVEWQGSLYGVVHFVKYSQPRCYYHSVVRFHKDTLKPEQYALPFSFCEPKIEYCLGFHIKDGVAWFAFSRNDCDASMIRVPLAHLTMIPC